MLASRLAVKDMKRNSSSDCHKPATLHQTALACLMLAKQHQNKSTLLASKLNYSGFAGNI